MALGRFALERASAGLSSSELSVRHSRNSFVMRGVMRSGAVRPSGSSYRRWNRYLTLRAGLFEPVQELSSATVTAGRLMLCVSLSR